MRLVLDNIPIRHSPHVFNVQIDALGNTIKVLVCDAQDWADVSKAKTFEEKQPSIYSFYAVKEDMLNALPPKLSKDYYRLEKQYQHSKESPRLKLVTFFKKSDFKVAAPGLLYTKKRQLGLQDIVCRHKNGFQFIFYAADLPKATRHFIDKEKRLITILSRGSAKKLPQVLAGNLHFSIQQPKSNKPSHIAALFCPKLQKFKPNYISVIFGQLIDLKKNDPDDIQSLQIMARVGKKYRKAKMGNPFQHLSAVENKAILKSAPNLREFENSLNKQLRDMGYKKGRIDIFEAADQTDNPPELVVFFPTQLWVKVECFLRTVLQKSQEGQNDESQKLNIQAHDCGCFLITGPGERTYLKGVMDAVFKQLKSQGDVFKIEQELDGLVGSVALKEESAGRNKEIYYVLQFDQPDIPADLKKIFPHGKADRNTFLFQSDYVSVGDLKDALKRLKAIVNSVREINERSYGYCTAEISYSEDGTAYELAKLSLKKGDPVVPYTLSEPDKDSIKNQKKIIYQKENGVDKWYLHGSDVDGNLFRKEITDAESIDALNAVSEDRSSAGHKKKLSEITRSFGVTVRKANGGLPYKLALSEAGLSDGDPVVPYTLSEADEFSIKNKKKIIYEKENGVDKWYIHASKADSILFHKEITRTVHIDSLNAMSEGKKSEEHQKNLSEIPLSFGVTVRKANSYCVKITTKNNFDLFFRCYLPKIRINTGEYIHPDAHEYLTMAQEAVFLVPDEKFVPQSALLSSFLTFDHCLLECVEAIINHLTFGVKFFGEDQIIVPFKLPESLIDTLKLQKVNNKSSSAHHYQYAAPCNKMDIAFHLWEHDYKLKKQIIEDINQSERDIEPLKKLAKVRRIVLNKRYCPELLAWKNLYGRCDFIVNDVAFFAIKLFDPTMPMQMPWSDPNNFLIYRAIASYEDNIAFNSDIGNLQQLINTQEKRELVKHCVKERERGGGGSYNKIRKNSALLLLEKHLISSHPGYTAAQVWAYIKGNCVPDMCYRPGNHYKNGSDGKGLTLESILQPLSSIMSFIQSLVISNDVETDELKKIM